MDRRAILLSLLFVASALANVPSAESADVVSSEKSVDVLIYGATPAGIAAAVAAGEQGRSVLLVAPYERIGGLTTNGLSHTDFHSLESLTGFFRDFCDRVEANYRREYGPDSPQVQDCYHGTFGEPKVNLLVFEQMLAEHDSISVVRGHRLREVEREGSRIVRVSFDDFWEGSLPLRVRSQIVIDATYEGDLMAAAGVEYRVGREAADEYGESLAPPEADDQVQGYNFRFTMTQDPANRIMPEAPPSYQRDDFLPVVDLLKAGRFEAVFVPQSGGIYKAHRPPLPNGKYDINDVSRGLVRLSLPDINNSWPDGPIDVRARLYLEHLQHNAGLLYFLQNDADVPEQYREEARTWGWCRDEFPETGHIPAQLYVREARRMVGRTVFTQQHTENAPGDARCVLHADAIAIGDYSHNCHGTDHIGPRFGGEHTGEFYKKTAVYQIPYGVLLPTDCENLLVPVACSSSHVGFCALRLEPIWTALGQAAGVAAHLALREDTPVADVAPEQIQAVLHEAGGATIYVSDVPPEHPDFAAVQWWGTLGGFHGLEPPPADGPRGAHIISQYYEAFPGHEAKLDEPLSDELRTRWVALARTHGVDDENLSEAKTRGEFVRAAFAAYR